MNRLPAVICVPLLAMLLAGPAAAQSVIVPGALANVDGNTNNAFPFGVSGGMRWQEVFNSNQFAGPIFIGRITFRPDAGAGFAFSQSLSSIRFSLSTTAFGPNSLSTTFANNLGADNTIVYNGPLTMNSANTAGPGNTRAFDVVVNLQTPFLYNPANGHLLLDVLNSSPEDHSFQILLDAESNAGNGFVSRVFGPPGNPGALTGSADPNGFVVQFTAAVPEPASLALIGTALIGASGVFWRRRQERALRGGPPRWLT